MDNFFNWEKDYELCGNKLGSQYNDEHRRMVALISQAHALHVANPESPITPIIREFVSSLDEHCQREERVMWETRYPGASQHNEEHEHLRFELELFLKQLDKKAEQSIERFLLFLKGWLSLHLITADKELNNYLSEKHF